MDRPRGTTRRRPRLSRSADFQRVYRQGDSVASRHFVLYAFPREGSSEEHVGEAVGDAGDEVRLGVSVGRRVGGAVERNRVKRLLREAFWELPERVPTSHDYVVVARQGAAELADSGGLDTVQGGARGAPRTARARRARRRRRGMSGALANAFTMPVRLYRRFISPALPRRCKYEPTCSAYALEALREHGALRGACWRAGDCCAATRSAMAGMTPSRHRGSSGDAGLREHPSTTDRCGRLAAPAAARRRRVQLGHVDHRDDRDRPARDRAPHDQADQVDERAAARCSRRSRSSRRSTRAIARP